MQKNSIAVFSAFVAASFATNPFAFAADPGLRNAGAAGSDIALCGFEDFEVGPFAPAEGSVWTAGDDAATVVAYEEGEGYSGAAPKPFEGVGDNYLSVEDKVTMTAVSSAGVTYIDALVQFPSASASEPSFPDDAKFCLWLQADGENTNLCARGSYYDYVDGAFTATPTNYVLTAENFSIEPGAWHHVSVASYDSGANLGTEQDPQYTPGFVVSVDGTELGVGENVDRMSDSVEGMIVGSGNFGQILNSSFIPSIAGIGSAGTVQSVGFHGSGLVDDVVVTTIDPASNLFTFSWPEGLESVKYVIDGITNTIESVSASNTVTVAAPADAAVSIIGSLGYRDVEIAGNTSSDTSLKLPDPGPVYYFANGTGTVADPFQIANVDDLKALRAAVAAGYGASSNYVQTADIDMASAGPFAGIGTYSKVPTAGKPFLGTYNGQNHKISNVTRAGGDTQGIFNQVGPSGVIENLVVENMTFDSGLTGEYGCAIVGNAGGGATLRNLTAAGVFGSAEKPSTHNMAGIVVRLSPGATAGAATTIDSCTNNATIYGGYTKLGGICAISQGQTGFTAGKVVFVNCANNGMLVCKRTTTGVTGNAGIVGYSSTNVELANCYGNGEITNADGANTDKDGALVGWGYDHTLTDNGGNSAPADKKMLGTWGNATETGFLFATVDSGIATTISGSPAVGGTYLLEGNATPAIVLADGDTIAFDTALGYTLTDTAITTAVTGKKVVSTTDGTVSTYSLANLATVTVTVTGGANATAVWTVNGEQVASAPATLTEGDTYSVAYTANEGYEFAEGAVTSASGTVGTEAISIAIDDATAVAADYKVVIEGADVTIEPTPEDLASLATYEVDTSSAEAVNAFLAGDIGTTGVKVWQALFLGLEPTAAGLAHFEISSIDIAADGSVSVKMPDLALMTGRGVDIVISVVASDDIDGDWSAATPVATATNSTVLQKATPASGETFKFYKVKASFSASAPAQEQQGE